MQRKQLSIAIAVVVAITVVAAAVVNTNRQVELHQIEVETKAQEIENLEKQLEDTKIKKGDTEAQIKEKNKKIKELQKSVEELQAKKAEEARIAAEQAQNAVYAAEEQPQPAPVAAPAGSCQDWMTAAGITDMANAYELIMRESGCNPNAVNPSSGACGIGQQLPCGKWAGAWNDPIAGMVAMQQYVTGRYGSWAAAVNFHNGANWY